MNKKGRKHKIDKIILRKLEEVFALGGTDEEACLYADIGKSTLYDYQNENPEFSERKHLLKQRPILLARQEVINGLKGNPELALKYLERRKKDEFGLRHEIVATEEVDILRLSYEQRLKRLREKNKTYKHI
ncbi:MAG: hypothetical protein WC938_00445 [Candidatus Paceibacterota bacterium]|jgi:hypothetical protein